MDLYTIAINLFGTLGLISVIIIYQQKDRMKMLYWKLISDLLWIAHYVFLGGTSAVAATSVAVMRSIVLINSRHRWAQGKHWLYIFLGTSVVLNLLAWQDFYSLMPFAVSISSIIAFWLDKPKLTRLISAPGALLYFLYTLHNHSLWGCLCEAFIFLSAVVGILRLDILKKPAAK